MKSNKFINITRWITALAVALSLPVVLAYAQEVGSEASSTSEVVKIPIVQISEATSTEITLPGEVMGTSTNATSTEPEVQEPAPVQQANSSGASSEPTPEATTTPEAPATTTPVVVPPVEEVASTTASSTEVIVPQKPVYEHRTVFIQPSIDIPSQVKAGKVSATVTLANNTCRFCDTWSPETVADIYIVPSDSRAGAAFDQKFASQSFQVPSIKGWATTTIQWAGDIPTPGKYYFVVTVDPANAIGARDMFSAEFTVE